MGTNIYLVRQITKKEIKETQTLFNSVLHNLETAGRPFFQYSL